MSTAKRVRSFSTLQRIKTKAQCPEIDTLAVLVSIEQKFIQSTGKKNGFYFVPTLFHSITHKLNEIKWKTV